MGRRAKFSVEQILDTTAELVAERGPGSATVSGIADRMGAPTGSIYHRFDSRGLLLAQLWIRTARRAQAGFVQALSQDDLDQAALDGALHIPRWSRAHLNDARVMLAYRREELAQEWPAELGAELETLNDTVVDAIRSYVRRRYGSVTKAHLSSVSFVLLDVPYAAVRRYLIAGEPPPRSVDDLVRRTCRCLLGINDGEPTR